MKETLLTILKKQQSEYVSGEDLSSLLSVSRTAVWKHVQSLRAEGYSIESSPRLGYRLLSAPDLLLPSEIKEGLLTSVIGHKVYHYYELDSTNGIARKLAAEGEPEGSLIVAESQSSGRGRLGRDWSSPAGGIWLSLILRPQLAPFQVQLLTLAAAVAAVEATGEVTGIYPGIKWPNDLVLSGRKMAGILTEVSAEMERVHYLILGIGINANIKKEDLPPELRGIATSLLAETGESVSRVSWVRHFLLSFESLYLEAGKHGFGRMLSCWRQFSVTLGREVTVSTTGRTVKGTALDIDTLGALQVKTEDGLETILAGDVTLRSI